MLLPRERLELLCLLSKSWSLILKDYFNKGRKEKFDKYTDTLLYLAARNEHIINKIKPALKRKQIIICDRFVDSTLAYQVYGKKVKKTFQKGS